MTDSAVSRSLFSFFTLGRLQVLLQRRKKIHTCPDCGAEMEANYKTLKRTGHRRARVFYARLAPERRIVELHSRIPVETYSDGGRICDKIRAIGLHGILSKSETRRVGKHYANASKIVHGAPCDVGRASIVVNAINDAIHSLDQLERREVTIA